jgi:hypothetical protein
MPFTVVNTMAGNPGLPVIRPEESKDGEMIVFVKPHPDGFCFVSTYEESGRVCVNHAEICTKSTWEKLMEVFREKGTEEWKDRIIEICKRNGIEHVRYDSSVFVQDGRDIRERLPEADVFLYRPRHNLIDRIAGYFNFIKLEIVYLNESDRTEEYNRFMSVLDGYNDVLSYEYRKDAHIPKEDYNIAMDILSDVAMYYRRNIL